MPSADAEDPAFISHYRAAELGYTERVLQRYLVTERLVYVEEVDSLTAPLKIMDKLIAGVTLFQNEGVVKELIKFVYHVEFLVVCYSAGEFTQLSNFSNDITLDLV